MKKLLLLSALLIFTCGFGQTPITDANFSQAIETCLSTHPVTGMCSDSEYGAMPDWDVSQVTSLYNAFYERAEFNADISNWDVGNVTNFERVFAYASAFNQPIGDWNISNATNIRYIFHYATSFNQPIGGWDVSNIIAYGATTGAFEDADSFNQDLSGWDVSNMTSIASMFHRADSFNQDLSSWDVSNITNMNWTFHRASSFNQNLSEWNIGNLETMGGCFAYSGLSTENYDNILIGWEQQNVQQNVLFGAWDKFYCNSENARQNLIINSGWTIDDAGYNCDTAGIDDLGINSFSIYPNPTKEYLNIDCSSLESVSVYNILGKELLKGNNNRINVSSLSKGVYFIKVSDGINASTKKFIKD